MNILYFTEYFPESEKAELTGGVEARTYFLAKELAKKHKVTIITTTQDKKRIDNFNNLQIIRCAKLPYTHVGHKLQRLKVARKMFKTGERFLKRNKVDIIDGYSFFNYYPAIKLAKKYKIKSFVNYHEVWLNRWIKNTGTITGIIGEVAERFVINKIKNTKTTCIAVSNFTRNKLIQAKIKPEKTTVVYNGVELKKYKPFKKYKEPTICSIGRLAPHKRIQDLIKAIKIVKQEIPDIKLKIIGKGPEKNNLKILAKQLNLGKNIEFLGFIEKQEDVLKVLSKSHLFSLPSVLEGFGIVTIEAAASQVPFISSNIPPTREITQGGKGGLLYTPKNYHEIAMCITTLLKEKKLYKQKQAEGKKLAKNFDWKILAKQLEQVYATELKLGLIT